MSERQRIRDAVRLQLQSERAVKIIIGAGQTASESWIATDVPAFDIRKRDHWRALFPPAAMDRILAEHVFEHLTREEMSTFLEIAREFLAPDGRVRIAVPDGCHPDADYINSVKPGGTGVGASDHKMLYTFELIGDLMQEQGWRFELLEYFDEAGKFHQREWSIDDGFVGRSADHDERNAEGRLNYTSLIVDCWPR
ncbi:MAG: hypothetical protein F4X02_12190 [Chloroflexi bacterium]|nr:hypothetical protein [Chloroflexota bacterium]